MQVLDFIRVTEIPKKHILKRWTKDAMDILPPSGGAWPKNLGGPAVGNYSRGCVSLAKNTYILQEYHMGWAGHGQFGLVVAPPLLPPHLVQY